MRLLIPQPAALAFTGGSPTYIYSEWSNSSVAYARNAVVRYAVSGVYYDYRCNWSHTSSASKAPTNTWYWTKLSASTASGGYTYTTSVRLSAYATWTSGAAVVAEAVQYDPADNRDYIAPSAILAASNTIRPSAAILSSDEDLAARWSVIGASNAWAPFDQEVFTRMAGYDSSSALVDPVTFTFTTTTTDTADALILAGLRNCEEITAAVTYGGTLKETLNAEITPATTHYGQMPTSAILDLATPIAAGTAISVAVTLDAYSATLPIELGVIAFAREFELAQTEWGVETRILSFSRKERDATFGTVKFVKRGSATQLTATCYYDPATISGDTLLQLLAQYDGEPIMMDFNNTGSNYDRLRVFGFYTNARTGIQHLSWESLSMDVESLIQ